LFIADHLTVTSAKKDTFDGRSSCQRSGNLIVVRLQI
jgi:hypothetical protein